jgi:hypothetical protein
MEFSLRSLLKFSRDIFVLAATAIAATFLSGCILIPIAGFGYTGYQYHEKEGVFAPGQPLGGGSPQAGKDDNTAKSSNSST